MSDSIRFWTKTQTETGTVSTAGDIVQAVVHLVT